MLRQPYILRPWTNAGFLRKAQIPLFRQSLRQVMSGKKVVRLVGNLSAVLYWRVVISDVCRLPAQNLWLFESRYVSQLYRPNFCKVVQFSYSLWQTTKKTPSLHAMLHYISRPIKLWFSVYCVCIRNRRENMQCELSRVSDQNVWNSKTCLRQGSDFSSRTCL